MFLLYLPSITPSPSSLSCSPLLFCPLATHFTRLCDRDTACAERSPSSSSSSFPSTFSQSNLPLLILDFRSKESFSNRRIRGSINLTLNSNSTKTSTSASTTTSTVDQSPLLLAFNSPMSKRRFSDILGSAFGSSRPSRNFSNSGQAEEVGLEALRENGESSQTREKRFVASRSASGTLMQGKGLELADRMKKQGQEEERMVEEQDQQQHSVQGSLISDQPPILPPLWHTRSDVLLLFDSATPSPSSPTDEMGQASTNPTAASLATDGPYRTSTSEASCGSSMQSASSPVSQTLSLGLLPSFQSEAGSSATTSPATSPGYIFSSSQAGSRNKNISRSQSMALEMAHHLRENEGEFRSKMGDEESRGVDGNLFFTSTNILDSREVDKVNWIAEGDETLGNQDEAQSPNSLGSSGTLRPATDFSFSGLAIVSPSSSNFKHLFSAPSSPRAATASQVNGNQQPVLRALSPTSVQTLSQSSSTSSSTYRARTPSPSLSSTSLLPPSGPPHSAAPSPSSTRSPARPGRPSLARLDTSERVKTLRSLQAAVPPIGKPDDGPRRPSAGPALSLNTSVQRQPVTRSATLGSGMVQNGASPSTGYPLSGRRPSLGLVIDNGTTSSGPNSRPPSRGQNRLPMHLSLAEEGASHFIGTDAFGVSKQSASPTLDQGQAWTQGFSFGTADPTIPHANGPRSASASEAGLGPYPGSEAWFLRGAQALEGASSERGPATAFPDMGGSHSAFSQHFSSPSVPLSVSEILPDFLYLGPDITSVQHVRSLQAQGVKRILNMAIEIDPETALLDAQLGEDKSVRLVDEFEKYHRVPMRDSVEEKEVQKGLLEVCSYLGESNIWFFISQLPAAIAD